MGQWLNLVKRPAGRGETSGSKRTFYKEVITLILIGTFLNEKHNFLCYGPVAQRYFAQKQKFA